ncbi:MAG: hypothetical protein F6K58_09855 [Symploca sp. SIO2E9]|nr:hypothetical protein [Symploca sp. SIO2E9]
MISPRLERLERLERLLNYFPTPFFAYLGDGEKNLYVLFLSQLDNLFLGVPL